MPWRLDLPWDDTVVELEEDVDWGRTAGTTANDGLPEYVKGRFQTPSRTTELGTAPWRLFRDRLGQWLRGAPVHPAGADGTWTVLVHFEPLQYSFYGSVVRPPWRLHLQDARSGPVKVLAERKLLPRDLEKWIKASEGEAIQWDTPDEVRDDEAARPSQVISFSYVDQGWWADVRLPSGDNVTIEDRKVRSYLLSKAHPVGRFKARVFASAGFTESTVEAFVSEIRRLAAVGEVSGVEDTEFGRKYTIPGTLTGPVKAVHVFTVWIEEPGQPAARLVTVQPR